MTIHDERYTWRPMTKDTHDERYTWRHMMKDTQDERYTWWKINKMKDTHDERYTRRKIHMTKDTHDERYTRWKIHMTKDTHDDTWRKIHMTKNIGRLVWNILLLLNWKKKSRHWSEYEREKNYTVDLIPFECQNCEMRKTSTDSFKDKTKPNTISTQTKKTIFVFFSPFFFVVSFSLVLTFREERGARSRGEERRGRERMTGLWHSSWQ